MSGDLPSSRLRTSDALATGLVGLRTKRTRVALTAVGIAIGIAAMVAVLGISASSRSDLLAELDRLGTNLLQVEPGQSFLGADAKLPEAAAAMIRRVRPVQAAAATRKVQNATVRRSDRIPEAETGGISVVATEPTLADVLGATLSSGTFLNDATARYPTVVLGAVAAERLGITTVRDAPVVWLGDAWFRVIGILEPVPLAADIDRSALVGYEVAKERFGIDSSASTVRVRTDPDQVEAVRAVLAATANPEAPNEVSVSRPSDALAAKAAADSALTALLLGLGAVALIVGGVGIANVMVISVIERRSEIGLRRALGATRKHIRLQFLVEAVMLASIGGVAGVVLGAVVTGGYSQVRGWSVEVPLLAVVGGVGAALTVGTIAGLYPASRAARLAPAEAVRPA